jgi:hypothetical protein
VKEDKIITLWALLEPWATEGLQTENGKSVKMAKLFFHVI